MRLQEPVIQVKGGPLFNISPFLFHFQDVSVLTLCFTLCLTLFFSAFVFVFVFVLVCVFVSLRVCVWRFVSLFFYFVVTDFVTLTCHVPCHVSNQTKEGPPKHFEPCVRLFPVYANAIPTRPLIPTAPMLLRRARSIPLRACPPRRGNFITLPLKKRHLPIVWNWLNPTDLLVRPKARPNDAWIPFQLPSPPPPPPLPCPRPNRPP